ncbi:MAG TPA: dipeptide epimerase, partial [Alphaproteobacteria bacterium]|nr:dipeptide epimerase [Alphaproteobacteria bacterium]
RAAAPRARLIADANESWTEENFAMNYRACQEAQVELIEQPLADGQDALLETWRGPIPICADESAHNIGDLEALAQRYQAINIKLDKT